MVQKLNIPTLNGVQDAELRIESYTLQTPVHTSAELSSRVQESLSELATDKEDEDLLPDIKLFFKCENLQTTGSFKLRGACNFLLTLDDKTLRCGVITYSTGNHALGLAHAVNTISKTKGFTIPYLVIMPQEASRSKIDAVQRLGARVTLHGPTFEECDQLARMIQKRTGAAIVPPAGHPWIANGQGTVMLEFYEQIAESDDGPLDVVVVPSSGGALLAGTAVVCAGLDEHVSVFGTEPARGSADLRHGREEGRRISELQYQYKTVADGLRSVVEPCNWEVVRQEHFVKGVFAVSDEEIREAMRIVIESVKLFIEPSSAVPVAALLFNREFQRQLLREKNPARHDGCLNVGVILTGGNTTLNAASELVRDNGK